MGMHINARKEAISNKLQGSIATHLSYGGDANNQIKKDLLPSLSVIFFWKSVKLQARRWIVSCTLCEWPSHC